LLLLSVFLISFSAVSAVELNETAVENPVIDDMSQNNEILSQDSTDEAIGDYSSQGSTSKINYKFSQTGFYYGETKLHVEITNRTNGDGIEGENIGFYVDDELWKNVKTDKNGLIDLDFKKSPGDYFIEAKILKGDDEFTIGECAMSVLGIPTSMSLSQDSAYYKDTKLTVKLTNLKTQKPASGVNITLKFSNGKTAKLTTNSKGKATYDVPFNPGTYSVTAATSSKYVKKNKATLKFTIGKTYLKIAANGFSTTYDSGKLLNIKVTNYFTKNAVKNLKLNLKVFTGKKYKTVTLTTNSNGAAKYDASQLSPGTHKIIIKSADKYTDNYEKTATVKVSKAKLSIQAPQITTNSNAAKNFKITVKNQETKNAMKNVNVAVKVYTGKSYKTYNLKTNSKGQASISTEGLSTSTHNVVITVKANSNINKATAKSTITITAP
jgi:hypothetical protein